MEPTSMGLGLGFTDIDLTTISGSGPSGDALILESGDYLLLESGDFLLLE